MIGFYPLSRTEHNSNGAATYDSPIIYVSFLIDGNSLVVRSTETYYVSRTLLVVNEPFASKRLPVLICNYPTLTISPS
jgi:hypothetical protein